MEDVALVAESNEALGADEEDREDRGEEKRVFDCLFSRARKYAIAEEDIS